MPPMGGIVDGMEKTTVYLSAEQKAALGRTAKADGRSEATIIRAGIDHVTARHRVGEAVAPYSVTDDQASDDDDLGAHRPQWVSREAFLREVAHVQADPGLRADLRDLAPGTTDDLADR